MERPVTRALLATFIEYAAVGKVTPIEWHRFIVEHYLDPQMEAARRECGRILGGSGLRGVTDEKLDALRSLADKLRHGNSGAEEQRSVSTDEFEGARPSPKSLHIDYTKPARNLLLQCTFRFA